MGARKGVASQLVLVGHSVNMLIKLQVVEHAVIWRPKAQQIDSG